MYRGHRHDALTLVRSGDLGHGRLVAPVGHVAGKIFVRRIAEAPALPIGQRGQEVGEVGIEGMLRREWGQSPVLDSR